MRRPDRLHPDNPRFEGFLYASVGEDWLGQPVSVISALARLGFDPWDKAAQLDHAGQRAAQVTLSRQLSNLANVPGMWRDHDAVATRLVHLLPSYRARADTGQAAAAPHGDSMSPMDAFLMALLITLGIGMALAAGAGH